MSLSDLPDEILNLISIRLNGFDNCSLWMASDSKLRQRLVNNVITEFDIKYTIPGRYLWPGNFLKKLSKLSRLLLVVDPKVSHLPIQNLELFPIPSLKSLKFDFTNSYQGFYQNRLIAFDDPTGPTTSSSDKYINLNEHYSNLEHIEVIFLQSQRMSIDFLRCLPRKLKTLLIPRNYLKVDLTNATHHLNTTIETLPESLTELYLSFDNPSENKPYLDLSKLPLNLTSLTINVCLDKQTYHMIPKSIKELCLLSHICNIEELSPYLPSGLENLSIRINGNSSTGQLLKRFENLKDISLNSMDQIILDDYFIKCPSTLKSFTCSNLVFNDLSLPSGLLSNSLTVLVLNESIGINAPFISCLPQTLTNFGWYSSVHQPFPFFSLLPRNLESLFTGMEIVENTSLLPGSLTFLSFATNKPCNPSYFDRLPPKLKTLRIQQNLPRSIMKQLPEGLEDINLRPKEVIDDEIIRMLPRGLKNMF